MRAAGRRPQAAFTLHVTAGARLTGPTAQLAFGASALAARTGWYPSAQRGCRASKNMILMIMIIITIISILIVILNVIYIYIYY